jgi:N-acetylglutamate synthase-like GNAT family acetyltransferase
MNLKIRETERNDIPKILELQTSWHGENLTYGYVPDTEQDLIQKLGCYFLCAENDNEIVGFACGSIHEAYQMAIFIDSEQYLEIDDIYIVPEHRNSGVGSVLLNRLLDTAKQNGTSRFYINSASKNLDKVIQFYRKQDFKTWSVQMFI